MIETEFIPRINRSNSRISIFCLLSFLFFLNFCFSDSNAKSIREATPAYLHQSEIKKINDWQYFLGDLKKDPNGNYVFGDTSTSEIKWKNSKQSLFPNYGNKILWLRTKMPVINGIAPAIFVNRVKQVMDVYFNGENIFNNRSFISNNETIRLLGYRWYIVKIPDSVSNKYIYFKFYS